MSHFFNGFSDELGKSASVAVAAGMMAASRTGINALTHWVMNTKYSPKAVKNFIQNASNDFLSAGFRHAVSGQKIKPVTTAAIATTISPEAIYMYETGYGYGRKVHETMKKIPLADAATPFKTIQRADTAASATLKTAPYSGILAGTGYGYATGKSKDNPIPLKSMAAGALTGGLIGKGVKGYGPHAPVLKQLKYIRENIADPVLRNSQTRIGRTLDRLASPLKPQG